MAWPTQSFAISSTGNSGNMNLGTKHGGSFQHSSSRQALMDTLSPELVDKNANTAADYINQVYNTRRDEIRRKYSDFPDMASADENEMERARANALAKSRLDADTRANSSRQSLLMQLEQMDENRRRFDEGMDLKNASMINAQLSANRVANAEKRRADSSRQMAMGGSFIDITGKRSMGAPKLGASSLNGPYDRDAFVQSTIGRPGPGNASTYDPTANWQKDVRDYVTGGPAVNPRVVASYNNRGSSRGTAVNNIAKAGNFIRLGSAINRV